MEKITHGALFLVAFVAVVQGIKIINDLDKTPHTDCHALHKAGHNISGVYWIHVNGSQLLVPCEFRDGVGETIFLRRVDPTLSFTTTWSFYESGFGNVRGNFWLGLAHLYAMTLRGSVLNVYMVDWSGHQYRYTYNTFSLGPRDQRYRLHIGGYTGRVPEDLSYQDGMPFSTYDAPDPNGCAANMQAGWWYNYCAYTLPTGRYYPNGWYHPSGRFFDGIFWKDLYGENYSMKSFIMTIRPRTA